MWETIVNEKRQGEAIYTGVSNFAKDNLEDMFGGDHADI